MRTIEEAIQEETKRYVETCLMVGEFRATATERVRLAHRAHIQRLAIQRLKHHVVTPHEALKATVGV